jgi:hypothetical protein
MAIKVLLSFDIVRIVLNSSAGYSDLEYRSKAGQVEGQSVTA